MLKVVLDSNIFISGIIFGGKPRKIINLIIEGKIRLYISSDILLEIKEVLERDKFGFSQTITQQIIFEIESLSYLVTPKNKHSIVSRDGDDNIIIDCAVEAKADYIITGDNDLLSLKEYKSTKIINASELISLIL
ncbi:MAG: putative toxin-antitoxin system toxin component, PIN family [Spirochaetes bacterium RBG_16_49_21]|nr:MAG: putative toxin-antitoxin system toxin component, PIN family [Spirochaetes bacterium RBG_16_49_21]